MFFRHDICYTDGATAVDAHLTMDQAAPALTTRPVNKRPRVLKVHQNGVAIVVMGLELFVRDPSFLWIWAVKTVSTLVVFLPRTVQDMCDSQSLEHVDFVCILFAADEDVVEELSWALRGTEATEVGGQHVLDPLEVLLALGVQRHRGWQRGPGVTRMVTEGIDLDLEVKGRRFNSSPHGQNGHHFADYVFKCIFINFIFFISTRIALNFVPEDPTDNKSALFQIMDWRRTSGKPLFEPMLTQFTDAHMRH